MIKILVSFILGSILLSCNTGQPIATLEVELPDSTMGIDVPASINLDNITTYTGDLSLFEVTNGQSIEVPVQISNGEKRVLSWLVTGDNSIDKRKYELVKGKSAEAEIVQATKEDGGLVIHEGDKNLLRYQFETMYPPAGVDSVFKRSAFIHPLWAPHGQELTRIQAPDHMHHYGIWNPWTHVLFENDTIDFWNLMRGEGTVRFAEFQSILEGPVFAEYKSLHEHVVLKNGQDKVALNEVQKVRVYKPEKNPELFIVDITFTYNCATDSPFKMLEYRYEGLGWRTTEFWNNQNSEVLSSEGKTRIDVDGTKARWCIVQGEVEDNDYAGAVMMSYPSNYNYPEPLRIWPIDQYGRGDMFASFSTTKDTDWLLEPGKEYVLKYRFLVFNGHMDAEKAESAWKYFAESPNVNVLKN
ncbi:MAG: PmoA family protein [Bacteroidales bacterium]|nr:PmoA family protein [Bacteroidales bacterium]